ncbi:SDR family NAD(P)-dependent oxidoreductase [Rhizorhapis sp.]|uniref:SDR family NAD(P)-dependent oxidoreductase n=1 Tax=Rhizorhapis sp. TaxID=1968842 RepID=UPI002B45FFFE|nr:SDR family oxidoreductase [Rhizorhapis sp.]HKR17950.1 SDR family oxidoreductase [Rhizorhapis sp.]
MDRLNSLEGRRIIVTGSAQGIGLGIVKRALDLGAQVAAVDLNADGLAAIEAPEDRILRIAGDVSDHAFASNVVEQVAVTWGGIDCLANNAGVSRPAMIDKMTIEQWQKVMDVNLTGCFLFLQAVGRHLLERARNGERGHGSIVNISSDAGKRGSIGQINYASAKAGLLGMTMSAAREWAKHEIRVNAVCFGVVETPMTEVVRGEKFRDGILAQIPMGRWSQPEEASSAVCYLFSNGASYITGQSISVNGGYHIAI